MLTKHLLLGQTLSFDSDPFSTPIEAATRVNSAGGVLIENGIVTAVGDGAALQGTHPDAAVTDYGQKLIMAGFVDAHVHYPQTAMIASWGKRLIDWLNSYTFPEEMRFEDADYAAEIAARYLDLTADCGTTTMCSYGTIHPASVDAFFTEGKRRGQRVIAGKTCMDRNAPDGLRDTPKSAYDDSKTLLETWHGVDRLSYAITPRFSPTSTPEQLEAMGEAGAARVAERHDALKEGARLAERMIKYSR